MRTQEVSTLKEAPFALETRIREAPVPEAHVQRPPRVPEALDSTEPDTHRCFLRSYTHDKVWALSFTSRTYCWSLARLNLTHPHPSTNGPHSFVHARLSDLPRSFTPSPQCRLGNGAAHRKH